MARKRALTKQEMAALDRLVGKTSPGILTARDVVQAAKTKTNPLHGRFDWDKDKAAMQWWLEQARDIIQVYVTVVNGNGEPVHAYVSVATSTGVDGYIPIRTALSSAETMVELRKMFASDLRSVLKRHSYLRQSLRGVFAAVERAAASIVSAKK